MRPPWFRRNVTLLAACQAMTNSIVVIQFSLGGLAGLTLSTDKSLATLPIAAMITGTAASTLPASLMMGRFGRLAGFRIGGALGLLASAVAAYALWQGIFWLFCLGLAGFGAFSAISQHYRFTAAEIAPSGLRARAISFVMAGGIAAAIIGPEVGKATADLFPPYTFLGCFLAAAVLCAIAVFLQTLLVLPAESHAVGHTDAREPARPWREIAGQPRFVIAVVSASLGYGAMSFLMTATPLAMVGCGYGYGDAATVIQAHVLGMYGPSFFTGGLIARFGVMRILATGAILVAICAGVALTGLTMGHFIVALVLLGIGWNFLFVGGTTLLTETYRPSERPAVQGVNDMAVFGASAVASLASGGALAQLGWDNLVWLSFTAPALIVLVMAGMTLLISKREVPTYP